MEAFLKELAVKLYDIGAIKYDNFSTKYGLQSPICIDLSAIHSDPGLLYLLSKTLWYLRDIEECTHVFGIPYTAQLPIAGLISAQYKIPMLIRKKQIKPYQTKKMIKGVFKAGDTVVIIEDIITSGRNVIETVEVLKREGLKVNTALVVVDREQGGKKNLENRGISVKSLFTITQLINYLYEAGKLTRESVRVVEDYIKTVQASLKVDRLTESFTVRAQLANNSVAKKLFKLMCEKQTTLCLAADLTKSQEIIDLVNVTGPHIAVLKIHIDIIEDFEKDFIQKIKDIANKHNFLIMEDRKFADIGQVVSYQYRKGVYKIAEWADLITVHAISGTGIIQGIQDGLNGISEDRGIFIVAEMSSTGALTTEDYVKSAVTNFKDYALVSGFVCQNNIFSDLGLIQLTPGVNLSTSTDNWGQQYNALCDIVDSGADLVVVGRGITQAEDKLASVLQYKTVLWEAYENRIK